MAKPYALRKEAMKLYVENLLGIETILLLLNESKKSKKDLVSRKTLYNWKKEDEWDKLREEKYQGKKNEDILRELILAAYAGALQNNDALLHFAIPKHIEALVKVRQNKLDVKNIEESEKESKPKVITEETFNRIQREVLGLRPPKSDK